jgi:signal transduction histidine kinase
MNASTMPGIMRLPPFGNYSSERAIEQVLDEAARRGERWFSICRIPFILLTAVPWIAPPELGGDQMNSYRTWIVVPAAILAIVFSLWVIRHTLRGRVPGWVLGLSVAVDAILAFLALLGNVLPALLGSPLPDDEYLGNFRSPDGFVILLIIGCSGFRLSPPVVWLSAGINILLGAILIHLDHAYFELLDKEPILEYDASRLGLLLVYIAGATALALLVARQSRALALAGARDALRAHRTQYALHCLLQDHHDVRSLLSSVNLNAELVLRDLDDNHPQRTNAEHLREDLRTVSALVTALRERSFQELAAADGCLETDLARAVDAVSSIVSRRFPNVCIESDVADQLSVVVAGGTVLLERVLLNLMINACEGDGTRGAAKVWIRAYRDGRYVHIRVEDDGPGFPEAMLRESLVHTGTSKREGSGLGLFLVQSVVTASNGHLAVGHRPGGGASVHLTLPGKTG